MALSYEGPEVPYMGAILSNALQCDSGQSGMKLVFTNSGRRIIYS